MELISGEIKAEKLSTDGVLCFLKTRNELLRIKLVLDHHRALGVDRFFIVDNASDDGTAAFLKAQDDVTLFTNRDEFKNSAGGMNWLHPLLDFYGDGHWCLMIDADELFVYPGFEENKISELCTKLDKNSYEAAFSLMIDMYSNRPIARTDCVEGSSLIETCKYFDPFGYKLLSRSVLPFFAVRGGARERFFWGESPAALTPIMSKVPLIRWKKQYRYISSTHFMSCGPTHIAMFSGALLHFKYLSDFHQRAEDESTRGQMWNDGSEYKKHLEVLESDPSLSLFYRGSVLYGDSYSLCRYNLLQDVVSPEIQKHELNGIGVMKVIIISDEVVTNSTIRYLNIALADTARCTLVTFDDDEKRMIGELMDIAEPKNITWEAHSYFSCAIQNEDAISSIGAQLALMRMGVVCILSYSWADRRKIVELYLNISRLEAVMHGVVSLQNNIGEFIRGVSCNGAQTSLVRAERLDYLVAAANEDLARERRKTKDLISKITLSFESARLGPKTS